MGLNSIINYFKTCSVCVVGMKGSGKDVLFGNVIARRNEPYISNLDYTDGINYQKLDLSVLHCGENTYKDFIFNTIKPFNFPYKKGSDIYISDAGIYFPSQYNNQLNKEFPYIATYNALSRQCSRNSIHCNCQNLNRIYDKLREHCEIFIACQWCKFFGSLVIQQVIIYDKMESCINRVKPCAVTVPFMAKQEQISQVKMYLDNFYNTHGMVKPMTLIYFNRSSHDTYYFEKLLEVTYGQE